MKEVSITEAWAKKYPEQIVFAVSCDETGKPNIIPLGWSMPTSHQPPLVAISVGNTRYSYKLISKTKEFVLSFPSEKMSKEVMFCGTHSGQDIDKFKETGLTALPAKTVKPPLIKECIVNFECKVVSELKTGDHTI
ncbi:MAG: flavin reductase family protein, partial [Elusimicrobiota bacterium]|nr:flavin reductase family protein [Elusimicrobiota bacterium]